MEPRQGSRGMCGIPEYSDWGLGVGVYPSRVHPAMVTVTTEFWDTLYRGIVCAPSQDDPTMIAWLVYPSRDDPGIGWTYVLVSIPILR